MYVLFKGLVTLPLCISVSSIYMYAYIRNAYTQKLQTIFCYCGTFTAKLGSNFITFQLNFELMFKLQVFLLLAGSRCHSLYDSFSWAFGCRNRKWVPPFMCILTIFGSFLIVRWHGSIYRVLLFSLFVYSCCKILHVYFYITQLINVAWTSLLCYQALLFMLQSHRTFSCI